MKLVRRKIGKGRIRQKATVSEVRIDIGFSRQGCILPPNGGVREVMKRI